MATPTPVDIWGFILWRGLCTAGNQAQLRTGLSTKTRKFNDNLQKTENPDESSLLRSRQKINWTTSPKEIPKDPHTQCWRTHCPAKPPDSEVYSQHPAWLSGLLTGILVKYEQARIIRHLRKAPNMKDSQTNNVGKKTGGSRLCRKQKA